VKSIYPLLLNEKVKQEVIPEDIQQFVKRFPKNILICFGTLFNPEALFSAGYAKLCRKAPRIRIDFWTEV